MFPINNNPNIFGPKQNQGVKSDIKTERANEAAPVISEPILKIVNHRGLDLVGTINKTNVAQSPERLDDNGNKMLELAGITNKSYAYMSNKSDFQNTLARMDNVMTAGNVSAFKNSGEMRALDELFNIA